MVSDLHTAFRVAEIIPAPVSSLFQENPILPRHTFGDRKPKAMAGFLALKREKRELGAKLDALEVKIQSTREEIARLKEEQSATAESLKALTAESRRPRSRSALPRKNQQDGK